MAVAGLRKILTAVEVVLHEGGGDLDELLRRAVAAAVVENPWLGGGHIAFSEARGEAGCALSVPMWHKLVAARRSHYQAMEVRVPDAPRPSEIAVAVAGSTGPRPWARIGDRTTDAKVETAT